MAHRLPIVASDTPVNREICGEAAVYFSPLDPERLADQVRRVVSDASLRWRLLSEAERRVQNQFTWVGHVRRIPEASQSVLGESR